MGLSPPDVVVALYDLQLQADALVSRELQHLTPASALLRRTPVVSQPADARRPAEQQRELSSKVALSKMGSLAVDPLAANTNVQGVEYVLTGFDKLVNWARKSSMWPMTFGLA